MRRALEALTNMGLTADYENVTSINVVTSGKVNVERMMIQNIPPREDSLQVLITCRGTFDYSIALPSTSSSNLCMGLIRLDFDVVA